MRHECIAIIVKSTRFKQGLASHDLLFRETSLERYHHSTGPANPLINVHQIHPSRFNLTPVTASDAHLSSERSRSVAYWFFSLPLHPGALYSVLPDHSYVLKYLTFCSLQPTDLLPMIRTSRSISPFLDLQSSHRPRSLMRPKWRATSTFGKRSASLFRRASRRLDYLARYHPANWLTPSSRAFSWSELEE